MFGVAPIDGIRFAVMPPEVFNGTKASVHDTVGPQHWSELVKRLPTLS